MARDDFTKFTIEKLKARVAHRCSNPNCRVPTSAPSSNNGVNNIGIAAHICAASQGGPRYDESMSATERKSIDNAIWLCSNCSIEIDRDADRYTVSLLKLWKREAEETARVELGKKLPSNGEIIDTVAEALTGLPKSFIANAIANVHQASGKALESLDPRFLVKTTHKNGKTSIGIFAKENVKLSMKMVGESAKEYSEKHRQLLEHGKDIEIKTGGVSIEGSKLFNEICGNIKGVLRFSPMKPQATQKLWLVQNDTNLVESFDDIQGSISFGTRSFSFEGTACNGIFNFSYSKSLDNSNNKADIKISLCLDQWEGVSLTFLPYFDKILSLFSKMSRGWEVFTSLEIKGIKILSSVGMKVDSWEYVLDTNSFLHYVSCCKIISEAFKHNISYTFNISYTSEEHRYVADVAEVIDGKKVYRESNISSNATCELIVDDECNNAKILSQIKEPIFIKIVQQAGEKIELFGVGIELPPKIISLESVLPKVYGIVDEMKSGDVIKVEWIPQNGFKCTVSY